MCRSLKLTEAELTVVEAATSAERSFTTAFWPEHGAVAAVAGGFMIQACDTHGNRRTSGGDRFSLEIRGVAADAVQVGNHSGSDTSLTDPLRISAYCAGPTFCATWPEDKTLGSSPGN